MAQKAREIEYVDDLTGGLDAVPHIIRLDDRIWAVDLTAESWAKVYAALDFVLEVARESGAVQARNRAVKAWAKENGYDVPERGRIPNRVYMAYDAAQEEVE